MKKFLKIIIISLIIVAGRKVYSEPRTLSLFIGDFNNQPVVRMNVEIFINGDRSVYATDLKGFVNIEINDDYPIDLKVVTRYEYVHEDKTIFVLGVLNDKGVLVHVKNTYDFTVTGQDDLKKTITINSIEQNTNQRYNNQMITVYRYLSDSVDFYENTLNIYNEFDIPPFYVACFGTETGTFYFDDIAVISQQDMPINNENAPQNREWHEYNHHILYNLHKRWPRAPHGYEKNHAGFLNTTTSDSYVEGFAEFMSLMVGEFTGYDFGPVYHPIGSLEIDYLPVDYAGMAEEFAVAGVLWDLYDEKNDENVQITIHEIWEVLKLFNNDFTSVYENLIRLYPDLADDIAQIYLNHGFFINMKQGNGRWDFGEPHVSWPNRYRPGDYFIDLPMVGNRITFQYTPGEKVGSAGDRSRPVRRTTMVPVGHCIRTKDKSACYTVDFAFNDPNVANYTMKINNVDGEIKFAVPPPRYSCTVTLKPDGIECKKVLTIDSKDFYKKYQKSAKNKYFLNHNFSPLSDEGEEQKVNYRFYTEHDSDEAVLDPEGNVVTVFTEQKEYNPLGELIRPTNRIVFAQLAVAAIIIIILLRKRAR